jgi:hypothetical protein
MLIITREATIVTASNAGGLFQRSVECRNVRCAVELATKLADDQPFATKWVHDGKHR